MPHCSIINCLNSTRRVSRENGDVSFHSFPYDPILKGKWIDATGNKNWFPNKHSKICSIHFKESYCETSKLRRRRLSKTAFPTLHILQSISKGEFQNDITTTQAENAILSTPKIESSLANEISTSKVGAKSTKPQSTVKACIACLKTSCRLFSINALGLANTYNALVSGPPLDISGALPQDVCTICAIQLRKAQHLGAKCKRSQTLLLDAVREERQLALRDIEEIGSISSHLASPKFTTTHFTPNYYDLHINKENLESTNTSRLVETDWKDSHDATDTIYYAIVEDGELKETVELVDDIKVEDCDEERDDTKSEENKEDDSCLIDDVIKSEESDDNLNAASDEEDGTEIVISKVKPVFVDAKSKPTKTANENHRGINKKTKTTKERIPNEKKKRVPNERKKIKEQKWRDEKEAKDKIISEYFNVQELSLEEQILEQEKMKHVKSPYKCDSCYTCFKVESNFTAHMKKHSESSGPHKCIVCRIFFKDRRSYNIHMMKHRWRYTCKTCPFQERTLYRALLHINRHRSKVYKCDMCTDAVFRFKSSLSRHRRINHPSPLSCPLCGVGCTEDGLRRHYEWKHAGVSMTDPLPEDAPSCPQCDLTFVSDAALAKHTSLQHTMRKKWAQAKLDTLRGKSQKKRYMCDHCDETFAQRCLFQRHMWKAHGRLVQRHRPHTTSIKPNPGVVAQREAMSRQCHFCGKILSCEGHLLDHMDLHDESVSHPCPECGKQFATRTRMRTHWRTHTGRYPCPVCPKTFNAQSNCDRHIKDGVTYWSTGCQFCKKKLK